MIENQHLQLCNTDMPLYLRYTEQIKNKSHKKIIHYHKSTNKISSSHEWNNSVFLPQLNIEAIIMNNVHPKVLEIAYLPQKQCMYMSKTYYIIN